MPLIWLNRLLPFKVRSFRSNRSRSRAEEIGGIWISEAGKTRELKRGRNKIAKFRGAL